MNIEISEFQKASERIKGLAYETPLLYSATFSKDAHCDIFMKMENQQKTGSFKIRGAGNKIAKMIECGDRSPVVAASAGNHAQGVSHAASKFGIQSTIVMPEFAPIAKIQATESYGAHIVLHGNGYDDAYQKACDICEKEGAKFIHPFDDIDVITGQGTVALEILEQLPDADVVLVPAGGGGLLAGVACAIKQLRPDVKVYGVQSENADAIAKSFECKGHAETETAVTIADGIAVKNPGLITTELINQYADGIIRVSDDDIAYSVFMLMERCKHVVEPAGATTIAAALSGAIDMTGKKVVCLLSGGNIDVTLISDIIDRSLAYRSRIIDFYVTIPRLGRNLEKVMNIICENKGNMLYFERINSGYVPDQNSTCYLIRVETHGPEHSQKILKEIADAGYKVIYCSEIAKNIL